MRTASNEERKVVGADGEEFTVFANREQCLARGFELDAIIRTCFKERARAVGVAPAPKGSRWAGELVLWYQKGDGRAYYFASGNLRDHGFKDFVSVDMKLEAAVGRTNDAMRKFPIKKGDVGHFFVLDNNGVGRIVKRGGMDNVDPDDIIGWCRPGPLDVNRG